MAALVDPVRRSLYDYVRRQDHPVTREEAADARAVSRNLAAFHLDKLVEVGLLRSRYEAPRNQPRGRGRTPKVYEPAGGLEVSVPERRYELVGRILADAMADNQGDAGQAALAEAERHGRRLGEAARYQSEGEIGILLAELGFEPRPGPPGRIVLDNCPFHALAVRQPALICGLNRAFVEGLLAGLGATGLAARLAPRPDACCVEVGPVE
jgi:predicted ArsR family transcriptional regulator